MQEDGNTIMKLPPVETRSACYMSRVLAHALRTRVPPQLGYVEKEKSWLSKHIYINKSKIKQYNTKTLHLINKRYILKRYHPTKYHNLLNNYNQKMVRIQQKNDLLKLPKNTKCQQLNKIKNQKSKIFCNTNS